MSKQSQTADKEWSSSLGVDQGLKTPHHKENKDIMKCYSNLMHVSCFFPIHSLHDVCCSMSNLLSIEYHYSITALSAHTIKPVQTKMFHCSIFFKQRFC
jgi:hypothetical protein